MNHRLFFACLYFILISLTLNAQDSDIYYPEEIWRNANPVDVGFPEDFANSLDSAISDSDFGGLRSLLVVKDGSLVYEYYRSDSSDSLHGVRSVTKSVMATVIGIALHRGNLETIDISLGDAIPEYFENETANADSAHITMRNLLMMRSGISWDDTSSNVIRMRSNAQDHTPWILSLPLVAPPGFVWNYSTADSQLVSVMFQHLVGESLNDYAETHLFEPLGIEEWDWRENGGYSSGGAELSLHPQDMTRIGYLYTQNGFWEGEQLLSQEWIELTTSSQNEPEYYAYQWWILSAEDSAQHVYAAAGFGGQFIYVIPDDDLIVVATNDWRVSDTTSDHQYEITRNLVRDNILAHIIELE